MGPRVTTEVTWGPDVLASIGSRGPTADRLLLKPEAEIEGLDTDAVIQRLLGQVDVPR